jgi:formate-nitrite transporter family protein
VAAVAEELTPEEIYDRAEKEGARRLYMPAMEQVSTGFIAGVTIVFGIVALGLAETYTEPQFGPEFAKLAGAFAFGIGFVFLVMGRSELFTENFFDPVATAIDEGGLGVWSRLVRLWVVMLALNLVGGIAMAAVFAVDGALPPGAPESLAGVAAELAATEWTATFARAVAAGALLTLLSYMLNAADSSGSRSAVAYIAGVFVAAGPFDHVVVSALHLVFGVWFGTGDYGTVGANMGIAAAGNLVGGLVFVTLTHTAQVRASRTNADRG